MKNHFGRGMAENNAEKRVERLLKAANDASRLVRRVYITFLIVSTIIGAVIWSTTDEQLLKGSPLTLPQLNIGQRIDAVYGALNWVILVLHFNLLLLLTILARNLRRLEAAFGHSSFSGIEREDFRVRLFPFPLSQMLIGSHREWGVRPLVSMVVWVTMIPLPLLLLLWVQIRFLPYHNEWAIFGQRATVMVDLILILFFWPRIMAWGGRLHRRPSFLVLVVMSLLVLLFSLFVPVVPGERLERWSVWLTPESWRIKHERCAGENEECFPLTFFLFDAADAPFYRNLRLAGITFFAGEPSAEVLVALRSKKETTRQSAREKVLGFNLANRDLRFADLRNTLLTKANLRGANLDRANLIGADLSGADFRPFDVTDRGTCVLDEPPKALTEAEQRGLGIKALRKEGKFCPTSLKQAKLRGALLVMARLQRAHLQRADLWEAQLQGAFLREAQLEGAELLFAKLQRADLSGAQLQGADLSFAQLLGAGLSRANLDGADLFEAQLQGANLANARLRNARLIKVQLQGANLSDAQLEGANLKDARLEGADLQGAVLRRARLQGADLSGAQLQGADLSLAELDGADLSGARLQGADLRGARLQGVDLSGAKLQGADLSYARLQGADLREAKVGGAKFDSADLSHSDLREMDRKPLTGKDYEKLREELAKDVGDEALRKGILDTLKEAIDRFDNLEKAETAENVLCGAPVLLPGKPCPSTQTIEEYDKRLMAQVLRSLGCGDPAIALGLARRAVTAARFERGRPLGRLLASALLDPKCAGGAALPEETKARLRAIAQRQ